MLQRTLALTIASLLAAAPAALAQYGWLQQPTSNPKATPPAGAPPTNPPAAPAPATTATTAQAARPFDMYWCFTGTKRGEFSTAGLPVRTDVVILYEHRLGLYPSLYNNTVQNGGVPQAVNMSAHLAKVRTDLDREIPDRNFAGVAIIDYEAWFPDFDQSKEEFRQLSRQLARQRNPGRSPAEIETIARAEFNEAARRFMLETLLLGKQLRPNAKWGYYAYPDAWNSERFRSFRWLFEQSDVIMPDIYPHHFTVPDNVTPGPWQIRASDRRKIILDTLAVARDLAGPKKPVLAFVMFSYHQWNKQYAGKIVNDLDLDLLLNVPRDAGADGLILWHHMDDAQYIASYRDFIRNSLQGALSRAATSALRAPANPQGAKPR